MRFTKKQLHEAKQLMASETEERCLRDGRRSGFRALMLAFVFGIVAGVVANRAGYNLGNIIVEWATKRMNRVEPVEVTTTLLPGTTTTIKYDGTDEDNQNRYNAIFEAKPKTSASSDATQGAPR